MESERLRYREICENDAEVIVKWRSDIDAYKFFLSPHKITMEEHLNWYRNSYLKNENRKDYIAILKKSNLPVGVFGIVFLQDTVEVNYLLSREFRGNGYAYESVSYLLQYAKSIWKCERAIAEIHKDNASSLKLVEKLGFTEYDRNDNIIRFEKRI